MKLDEIKGIGPKTLEQLNKLNIYNLDNLITYYPFRYNFIKKIEPSNLNKEEKIIIDGIIEKNPSIYHISKKMDKMSFSINTGKTIYNVVIYNRGFLKSKILIGSPMTIIGKYDAKHNLIIASDLRFGLLPPNPIIEPIYHTTFGISSNQIKSFIDDALIVQNKIDHFIPEYLIKKYTYIDKLSAIKIVHNPTDLKKLNVALETLKYEELFIYMMKLKYLKENKRNLIGLERTVDYNQVEKFIASLPFILTEDQLKSVKTIYDDLLSPKRMNRLLQGDVGSGKTIVSIVAIYINYLSNYQSALMAPTEILAYQHYSNIKKIFKDYNIRVLLLTGKSKNKKEIYEMLKNGDIDVLIGTHAIINDSVIYDNLGLVITDEQHRFGVNQRTNLKNKGITPDILYMSATPIPRTYALTIYGDMDISSIKSMPNGRKQVITTLKKNSEIKDVLKMMLNELRQNHQIYVIAPLVEESDKIELENVNNLYNNMNKAFSKYFKVGLLHGKMNNQENDDVINNFKNNDIQVLVSTTVIEVGIDVENATMMVIFDSYRFGLSTLHQLRGRVGRNSLQSYCILLSDKDSERLDILTKTNDGFKISEEDFKLRGSGDLFGIKQSGDMKFYLADIKKDYDLLLKAKDDVDQLVNSKDYVNMNNYLQLKSKIEEIKELDS